MTDRPNIDVSDMVEPDDIDDFDRDADSSDDSEDDNSYSFTCNLCQNTFFEDEGVERHEVFIDPPSRPSSVYVVVGAETLHDVITVFEMETSEILAESNYESVREIPSDFTEIDPTNPVKVMEDVPAVIDEGEDVTEGPTLDPLHTILNAKESVVRLDKAIHEQLRVEMENVKKYGRLENDPKSSDTHPDSRYQFKVELPVPAANPEPDWIVCEYCRESRNNRGND